MNFEKLASKDEDKNIGWSKLKNTKKDSPN